MLSLEAVVLGLSVPVMISVEDVDTGTALGIGLGLAALCVVTAGLLRLAWAYWLGHAIQLAAIGLGVLVPMMYAVGALFAALWFAAFFLGRKIEADKARWAAEAEG
jgi:hypothetical protein